VTWVKWKAVSISLDIVLSSAQDSCTECDESTTGVEIALGTPASTPRYVKWKLVSLHLEIVLVSTQDRCTVCGENTIGLEIIFVTLGGTPR
jgi:hypothetical protein